MNELQVADILRENDICYNTISVYDDVIYIWMYDVEFDELKVINDIFKPTNRFWVYPEDDSDVEKIEMIIELHGVV
jgi:hypothetical protein